MASNYSAYGSVIGSAVGAYTSVMAVKEQNKALEEQARLNNELLEKQTQLINFSINNNINRTNEAILSYNDYYSKVEDKFKVSAKKEISKQTNEIFSGITAGNTQARKIQTAYREMEGKLGEIDVKESEVILNTLEQSRNDNAILHSQNISNYNNSVIQNTQLASKSIDGMNASLMILNSGISGFQTGYTAGSGIDKNLESKTALDASQLELRNSEDRLNNAGNEVSNTLLVK